MSGLEKQFFKRVMLPKLLK